MAAGLILVCLFGSALDGPEDSMRIVYAGIIVGLALMFIGGVQAQLFTRGGDEVDDYRYRKCDAEDRKTS